MHALFAAGTQTLRKDGAPRRHFRASCYSSNSAFHGGHIRMCRGRANQVITESHTTADDLASERKSDAVVAYIESISSGHVG